MRKNLAFLVAVFLTGLSAAPAANAQWAVVCALCASEVTVSTIANTAAQIKTSLDQGVNKIVDAIQGASTAQTTATSESAKMVSEAGAKTASDMKKVDIEQKAEPLDPCGVTAVAKGGSEANSNRPSGSGRGGGGGSGGGGSSTPTAGATNEMVKALKISNGEIAAPAPELAAALASKGACGTFAKSGTLRGNSCENAGFAAGNSSGFANADIKAETLFDGPQNADDISKGLVRKLTIKPGSAEQTAINAFVRNLETPLDLRTLTKTELNSEAGRNYMAIRDSYDAALSLANKPLRDQESGITANKATLPILKQLMKSEDARYVSAYLDKAYPSWKSDGVSYAELMNLEARRRYLNEDWHIRMAAANEKQLLAEQVQMQALAGWMNVALLEKTQQLGIIQGAAAGAAIRAEKMPMLVAAHKAAKR